MKSFEWKITGCLMCTKPKLGVDLDGVIFDQMAAFMLWAAQRGHLPSNCAPSSYNLTDMYDDPDSGSRLMSDWVSTGDVVEQYLFPGVAPGIRRLAERYDLTVVTARPPNILTRYGMTVKDATIHRLECFGLTEHITDYIFTSQPKHEVWGHTLIDDSDEALTNYQISLRIQPVRSYNGQLDGYGFRGNWNQIVRWLLNK